MLRRQERKARFQRELCEVKPASSPRGFPGEGRGPAEMAARGSATLHPRRIPAQAGIQGQAEQQLRRLLENGCMGAAWRIAGDAGIRRSVAYQAGAACRASSPVSNLTVRVPNLPLSRTVSTALMTGSVTCDSFVRGAIRDSRARAPGRTLGRVGRSSIETRRAAPGAPSLKVTTEDRAGRWRGSLL